MTLNDIKNCFILENTYKPISQSTKETHRDLIIKNITITKQ